MVYSEESQLSPVYGLKDRPHWAPIWRKSVQFSQTYCSPDFSSADDFGQYGQIFARAERFVFLAICTRPALAVLPSGQNAHCTVEPMEFWKKMVETYTPKPVYTHIKTYGNCNNYEILNEELYLEWMLDQIEETRDRSVNQTN